MFSFLQVGKNLHFYVTVSDGQYSAKSEVNVNIQDSRIPINPSKPITLPFNFGRKSIMNNFKGIYSRPTQSTQSKKPQNSDYSPDGNLPAVLNIFHPNYSISHRNEMLTQKMVDNQSTSLKLIPIKPFNHVETNLQHSTGSVTTPRQNQTAKKVLNDDSEFENNSLEPIQSSTEDTSIFVPILSVLVVFCTVGAVAILFRKNIYFAGTKDIKKSTVSTPKICW